MVKEKDIEYLLVEGNKIFGEKPHLLTITEYTTALAKWDATLL